VHYCGFRRLRDVPRSRLLQWSPPVTRYFLHLRDGSDEVLDPDGIEFKDIESLRLAVMKNARDTIAGDVQNGLVDFRYRIDAENDAGQVVYSLPFKHAVNVIPEVI
jgi:hypothetical protein